MLKSQFAACLQIKCLKKTRVARSPVALVLGGLLLVLAVEAVVGVRGRRRAGHEAVRARLHVVRHEVRRHPDGHLAHRPRRVVRQVRRQRADAQLRLRAQATVAVIRFEGPIGTSAPGWALRMLNEPAVRRCAAPAEHTHIQRERNIKDRYPVRRTFLIHPPLMRFCQIFSTPSSSDDWGQSHVRFFYTCTLQQRPGNNIDVKL